MAKLELKNFERFLVKKNIQASFFLNDMKANAVVKATTGHVSKV